MIAHLHQSDHDMHTQFESAASIYEDEIFSVTFPEERTVRIYDVEALYPADSGMDSQFYHVNIRDKFGREMHSIRTDQWKDACEALRVLTMYYGT